MALQNVHRIEADIKQKRYVEEPRVTSNDDIAFIVTVTDNGQPVDMAAVTMVLLASTRTDRQTVITPGTVEPDGSLLFELGSSETGISGQVKGVAQLFDAEGDRISSVVFTYQVDRDPTGDGYIPTEKDKTFIEIVLVEGPAVIQEAKDITAAANQAVIDADGAADRANIAAEHVEEMMGTSNQNVFQQISLLQPVDTRATEIIRENGYVKTTRELDGSTLVRLTEIIRDANGQVTNAIQTAGGKRVTISMTRDGEGNVSGITKGVEAIV